MTPLDLFSLIAVGLIGFSFLFYWLVYRWERARRRARARSSHGPNDQIELRDQDVHKILIRWKLATSHGR